MAHGLSAYDKNSISVSTSIGRAASAAIEAAGHRARGRAHMAAMRDFTHHQAADAIYRRAGRPDASSIQAMMPRKHQRSPFGIISDDT